MITYQKLKVVGFITVFLLGAVLPVFISLVWAETTIILKHNDAGTSYKRLTSWPYEFPFQYRLSRTSPESSITCTPGTNYCIGYDDYSITTITDYFALAIDLLLWIIVPFLLFFIHPHKRREVAAV